MQHLADLFTTAGALADTNDDGYADGIALRFIVPGAPTAWEWCALADLAAVLDLHVTGFSPPLVVDAWDGPTLLLDPADDDALQPGVGRVTLNANTLTVRGGDAAGRASMLRALAQGSPPQATEWQVTAAQYPAPTPQPIPADPGPPPTLEDLFMTHGDPDRSPGLLTDRDGDRLPDDTRCSLVLPENISHETGRVLVDFAARIGIETTGLTVPLCAPVDLGAAVPVFIGGAAPTEMRSDRPSLHRLADGRTALIIAGEADVQTAAMLRSLATAQSIGTGSPPFAEPQPATETIWSWQWQGKTEREILLAELDEHLFPLPNDAPCDVLIQISEDTEQRATIRDELRGMFPDGSTITILPVYHAGRAWLEEVVTPAAKELRGLVALEVTCKPLISERPYPMLNLPIFWLQECWPADEIIAPVLGLPLEQVRISLGEADQRVTYLARAIDENGNVLREWSFSPGSALRPYLLNDLSDGAQRDVWLGATRIRVYQGGETRLDLMDFGDELESFWMRAWWKEVLPQLREYAVAQQAAGKAQPFFDELRIEVWVSEPEYALGIREERESPGEGLAEDLYFNTLDFFHELGKQVTGQPWDEPGQIVPLVHIAPGEPPRAKVSLLRYDTAKTIFAPVPVQERDSGVAMDEVVTGASLPGLLAYVDHFPAVTVRDVGRSYRGRTLAAVEVVKPDGAAVRSRAKLAAMKPTHLIVARHHANEVASTTAAFRLIELLASDPETTALLDRCNVIFIPDENPDGTALHATLMAEHPTWKHHAARYNAVGVEHASRMFDPETPYGEARVRPMLWKQWRPDVITDNHGVPSHEWWQPFAGGQNPPRFGISYWLCQALIYGICRHAPDAPHAAFAGAMREAVSRAIAAEPDLAEANRVYAERYERWGHRYVPEQFPATYHGDMLWFFGPAEANPDVPQRNVALREANMLSAAWVTEVIDETAQGAHLALVAKAHLTANLALLRMTAEHAPPVAFSATPLPGGYVCHRLHRMRPLPVPRHTGAAR
jgi:hypothetical protein